MGLRSVLARVSLLTAVLLSGCSQKAFPVRTYQMGEKVSLGSTVYTVFETQWLTHIGVPPDEKVPQNRYFLVRFSAVNGGGADLMLPALAVEDDTGKSYAEVTSDVGAPQWVGLVRQVHPAESIAGNMVFDCPPGHYKLRLSDEVSGHEALIDIPLTFTAETPEVPTPGDAKKR